jgi:zinc transporter, ZIP family
VSQEQIVVLGIIAGATIFIGLPIGRLTGAAAPLRAFLSAIAVGILLFLFWDVVSAAVDGIEAALHDAVAGTGAWGDFALLTATGAAGLAVSLLGLVGYERWLANRGASSAGPGAASVGESAGRPVAATGRQLAILIALGIGLHNFAEGLAIGQSAAAGELAFAGTLVIGFGLHNATEGFGIVAPLAGGPTRPSWAFLGAMGLIAGGPTVLGTLVGQAVVNTTLSVAFLGLAAGSILYVVIELLGVNRAFGLKVLASSGILVGLFLGFGTDFVLNALGG